MRFSFLTVLVAAAACSFAASAQSPAYLKEVDLQNRMLQGYVEGTNTVCNSNFSAAIDYSTVSEDDLLKSAHSISAYCNETLSAISNICSDENGKASIRKNITNIVCKRGAAFGVSLSGGTLTYTTAMPETNMFEKVQEYLNQNLR